METNLLLIPQTNCNLTNALRDYEAAHYNYMNVSIFTEEGLIAKQRMQAARDKYEAEYRKANPTHILM